MPSGWNQTGGYTGITLVLENWGVKMGSVCNEVQIGF